MIITVYAKIVVGFILEIEVENVSWYAVQAERILKQLKVPEGLEFEVEVSDIPGVDRITIYLVGLGQYVATDLWFNYSTLAHIDAITKSAARTLWQAFAEKLADRNIT